MNYFKKTISYNDTKPINERPPHLWTLHYRNVTSLVIDITTETNGARMKLLNTYDNKDEAEDAFNKINGEKRLASERDSTVVIYNLFGQPSWNNFYKLEMFNLPELQKLLSHRDAGEAIDQARHQEIITLLNYAAKTFELNIPKHWL